MLNNAEYTGARNTVINELRAERNRRRALNKIGGAVTLAILVLAGLPSLDLMYQNGSFSLPRYIPKAEVANDITDRLYYIFPPLTSLSIGMSMLFFERNIKELRSMRSVNHARRRFRALLYKRSPEFNELRKDEELRRRQALYKIGAFSFVGAVVLAGLEVGVSTSPQPNLEGVGMGFGIMAASFVGFGLYQLAERRNNVALLSQ